MFHRGIRKSLSILICIIYTLWCTGGVYAAQPEAVTAVQLAQYAVPSTGAELSAAEEDMIRWRYNNQIRNIEEDMNTARGQRNMLLTLAVANGFIGGGIAIGAQTIESTLGDMKEEFNIEDQKDVDIGLDMVKSLKSAGIVTLATGGVCILGYLLYSVGINDKQGQIETLQAQLDTRIKRQGMFVPTSESHRAVENKVAEMKKNVGAVQSMQGMFTRIAVGSLLSGGFLAGLGELADNIVGSIEVKIDDDLAAQDEALKRAKDLTSTGYILLGVGGGTGLLALISGLWANGQGKKIDQLEDSLLPRIANNIQLQPGIHGFQVTYSYQF